MTSLLVLGIMKLLLQWFNDLFSDSQCLNFTSIWFSGFAEEFLWFYEGMNMHNQQNKILIRKVKNRLHPWSYMEKIVRKSTC